MVLLSTTVQASLELLEKVPVLSPHSALLRCQTTLLLADVSCMPGVSSVKMVEVFRGLEVMLKHQVSRSTLTSVI